KISADGKSSENQATSGFAGIKAPKTNTFRQRLAFSVVVFSCSNGSDDVIGFPLLNVCNQS
ncbi:MAG: hypothetical protein ACYCY2_09390, partial [Acidithiobacillus ferriphilus]